MSELSLCILNHLLSPLTFLTENTIFSSELIIVIVKLTSSLNMAMANVEVDKFIKKIFD